MKPIIGKEYKVKQTPNGKVSSNGPGTRPGDDTDVKVKIVRKLNQNGHGQMYQAKLVYCPVGSVLYNQGYNQGNTYNFYDYELVLGPYNKEAIEEQITEINEKKAELDTEIGDLESKIEWMETVGVTEFDEDEYKVWKTLSLLEDNSVGKIEKMKEIAKMIKG
jgi:hypothetical protein